MVTIVEQLQQTFHEKIFVRKYFFPLLFVWNVLRSSKMKVFGDKIYFTGWSRLLKVFIEIATLQNRLQLLCRLELMRNQFLQLVCKKLPIFVVNLFGQDCWRKTIWEVGLNRLYEYFMNNNLLHEHQFGFQTNNSAEHALLQFTCDIAQNFDKGKFTLAVFMTFRRILIQSITKSYSKS